MAISVLKQVKGISVKLVSRGQMMNQFQPALIGCTHVNVIPPLHLRHHVYFTI